MGPIRPERHGLASGVGMGMKELAILALVALPLGMTIIEILAAGESSAPGSQDTDDEAHPNSDGNATAAPALDETRTRTRPSRLTHAPASLDGEAVPGDPAWQAPSRVR
jgi:hypothetical protein